MLFSKLKKRKDTAYKLSGITTETFMAYSPCCNTLLFHNNIKSISIVYLENLFVLHLLRQKENRDDSVFIPKCPPPTSTSFLGCGAILYACLLTSELAPSISSSWAMTIRSAALICGLHNTELNLTGTFGSTCVTLFFHFVLYLPPYSMNHRNAVNGFSIDGMVSWSKETTGMGPTVVSGVAETTPLRKVSFIDLKRLPSGSGRGNSDPQAGT